MITLKDFAPLSIAEQKLIDESNTPDRTTIGDGERPMEATDDLIVRAELLRFVFLDRNDGMVLHDKGIRLRGAWITGPLDLQGSNCDRDLSLSQCHLTDPINLVNAKLRGLHMSGCRLAGISADNASFSGSIYIRAASVVEGEISLAGARIAGDLQVCDATLVSPTQDAIFAPSLRVEGSVFLGNYPYAEGQTTLEATGLLFFSSARIDHDFFMTNTAISLTDDATAPAMFGATEEHGRNMTLSLARARVGGILFLQSNQINRGIVNLAGASVARLKDEPMGPGASYPIRLDGFRYTDFSRHTETDINARLDWLERRPEDTPFTAQPYEQLASVLQSMGHRNDARSVLMRKERLLRQENRRLMQARGGLGIRSSLSWISDVLLRYTIGYGYRPGRAVAIAFC